MKPGGKVCVQKRHTQNRPIAQFARTGNWVFYISIFTTTKHTSSLFLSMILSASGQNQPVEEPELKTSHFEERFATCCVNSTKERDERTQRELATLDIDLAANGCPTSGIARELAIHRETVGHSLV